MSVSPLTAPPAPPPPPALPAAATKDAPPAANDPAVQVRLSAEAEFSLTVYQRTTISVSIGGGEDPSGPKDGAKPATDRKAARALSTLEEVANAQRAWIKALEAQREGRRPQAAQGEGQDGHRKANADDAGSPRVQISVEQETVVEASLTVGAELDVSA